MAICSAGDFPPHHGRRDKYWMTLIGRNPPMALSENVVPQNGGNIYGNIMINKWIMDDYGTYGTWDSSGWSTFMTWPLTHTERCVGLGCKTSRKPVVQQYPGLAESTKSCDELSTLWPSQVDNLLHNAVTRVFCAALQWSKDPWRDADDADEPYGTYQTYHLFASIWYSRIYIYIDGYSTI